MMRKMDLDITGGLDGDMRMKMPTMPLTTKNLKGHSRMSSSIEGITNTSSMFTDRYMFEAERLDWSGTLTDKHKKMYDACNKFKKEYT